MILRVKLLPYSSKNEICEKIFIDDLECLKIKIKAPAIDNKANLELINFLAKILDIPKSSIKILKGEKNKFKILSLEIDEKVFFKKIENLEQS
ncbi:MAG: DUF167 domain-containing protein [Elusimicrobiota bacterium]|nr:DUF167 domain-containing protein [Elusimicrobiota bacterium]